MTRWTSMLCIGICICLSALPVSAFAHDDDAGNAVIGGIVGGVVGGLIGSAIAPDPLHVAPAPVIVPRDAPAPVIVETYGPPGVYERGRHLGWYGPRWRGHPRHHRHWHDAD
jgi:hypothetical protein